VLATDLLIAALVVVPALGFGAWVRATVVRIARDLHGLDGLESLDRDTRTAIDAADFGVASTPCR
jgi:hypothetical protein